MDVPAAMQQLLDAQPIVGPDLPTEPIVGADLLLTQPIPGLHFPAQYIPQLAPPTQPIPARRSHKNLLQESLVRGTHGLQICYADHMATILQDTAQPHIWISTVSLVNSSGQTRLSASGKGWRKSSAQDAAAAALLALPQFESLLQTLYSSSATAAAAAPPAAGVADPSIAPASAHDTTTACSAFDPGHNYKAQLQELVQQLQAAFALPTYTYTAAGPPHTQVFTSTVTIPYAPTAAAALPSSSLLAATGTPQSSRKAAEQAAAAALLSTPAMKGVLEALRGAGTRLDSTPAQQLNQLVARAAWCMEPICHRPLRLHAAGQPPIYEASITINGHLMAVGHGKSKSAATQAAASRVLQCMQPASPAPAAAPPIGAAGSSGTMVDKLGGSVSGTSAELPSPAQIQDASLQLFGQLAQQAIASKVISPATATQTALCTFLLQHGSHQSQVVALGTGTGCYAGPLTDLVATPAQHGKLLLDCHAEVVARRSLLRWLYTQAAGVLVLTQQLQQPEAQDPAASAVLHQALSALPLKLIQAHAEPNQQAAAAAAGAGTAQTGLHGMKFRLKPGVKLHMYISKPPCGDARDFNRPPASSIIITTSSNSSSSSSQLSCHFTQARPGQQQQLQAAAASVSPQDGPQRLLLPSDAALAAHWPQGCALLNPEAAPSNRGVLRYKVSGAENCSPTPPPAAAAAAAAAVSADDQAAACMRKMCCSDKVASWNAVGLQGALLGQLLEPVYINSITIGGQTVDFCEGAVCRAVCCRLAPDLPAGASSSSTRDVDQQCSERQHLLAAEGPSESPARMHAAVERGLKLPAPFRVNHPKVMHAAPSSTSSRWLPSTAGHRASSCVESLNWNAAEKGELEVCMSAIGAVTARLQVPQESAQTTAASTASARPPSNEGTLAMETSTPTSSSSSCSASSRLSKASMFERWMELQGMAEEVCGSSILAQAGALPYAAAKARNVGYFTAKSLLHQHFQQRAGSRQVWLKARDALHALECFVLDAAAEDEDVVDVDDDDFDIIC